MWLSLAQTHLKKKLTFFHLQDLFNSAGHWLQACGIYQKILYPYMNAEPLIPLPKKALNEGLKPVQLLMLFVVWSFGIALGSLAILAELAVGTKNKHQRKMKVKENAWEIQTVTTANGDSGQGHEDDISVLQEAE